MKELSALRFDQNASGSVRLANFEWADRKADEKLSKKKTKIQRIKVTTVE